MGRLKLDIESLAVVSWATAPEGESARDTRTWGCSLLSCAAACALPAER
jgi:hypothetical protein